MTIKVLEMFLFAMAGALIFFVGLIVFDYFETKRGYEQLLKECMQDGHKQYECIYMSRGRQE